MFDRLSDEAQEANFYPSLEEEVRTECARLSGAPVLHCRADKWSNGFIYVKFSAERDAVAAVARMHGRYFAKQRIVAEHMAEDAYDRKWPEARSLAGLMAGQPRG